MQMCLITAHCSRHCNRINEQSKQDIIKTWCHKVHTFTVPTTDVIHLSWTCPTLAWDLITMSQNISSWCLFSVFLCLSHALCGLTGLYLISPGGFTVARCPQAALFLKILLPQLSECQNWFSNNSLIIIRFYFYSRT